MQRDIVEVSLSSNILFLYTYLTHLSSQGYLNMKLLHRLRYILEVCRPQLPSVIRILEIMTRLCRHSMQAASEV